MCFRGISRLTGFGLLVISFAILLPASARGQTTTLSAGEAEEWIRSNLPFLYSWHPKSSLWKDGSLLIVKASYTRWNSCTIGIRVLESMDLGGNQLLEEDLNSAYVLRGNSYPGKEFPGTDKSLNDDSNARIQKLNESTRRIDFGNIDISSLHIVRGEAITADDTLNVFFLSDDRFSFPFEAQSDAQRMSKAFAYLARKCGAKASPF